MPRDPDIDPMTLDEAIKSVMMAGGETVLPPSEAKQVMLFVLAAAHPDKPTQKQIGVTVEWALQTRAQNKLLDYILSKKMTALPQEDGQMKFGGRLMKVDELASLIAQREAAKLGSKNGTHPPEENK